VYRFIFFLVLFPAFLFGEKPNILLITIDTFRADYVGAYGNKTIRTPNLDRIATQSLLFENAICSAPLTLPSHTSLMTGRYPFHHGVRDNAGSVPATELTLAEILRNNGYHTYAFVGGFPLDHRFGLNQGFDKYDDSFPRQKNRSLDFRSERTADAVVHSVFREKIAAPFFLWVHFYDPHAPYLNGGYSGEIEFVDQQIGLLLKQFKSYRPIIAVAGDHGESLGEHGEWTHRIFVYDSTMRVPFWISIPDEKPQRIKQQVRLIDFAPTLLNILKLQIPKDVDGVVLPAKAGQTAYLESMFPRLELGWSPVIAVRNDEWKLIQTPKPELYHLVDDTSESKNLFTSRPDIVKMLQKQFPLVGSVVNKSEISPEMAEQLASLGYVSSQTDVAAKNIDPKDRISVWNEIEKAVDLEKADPAEAISVLEKARKIDPDNPMILGFLAQKYAEGNRSNQAKAILQKVLARDPKNALALYRMASVCLQNNQAGEAKKWAGSLQKLEPENADAWILLGQANLQLGELELAIGNIQNALRIDPTDDDLRIDLGNLYLQTNRVPLAQQQFERVLKADSQSLQALNGMATSFFMEADLNSAESLLEKARSINKDDTQTLMNLALLYSKQGKKQEAIALYRKIASDSSTPEDWKDEAVQRLKELQ
jgi:choline-sulfatase